MNKYPTKLPYKNFVVYSHNFLLFHTWQILDRLINKQIKKRLFKCVKLSFTIFFLLLFCCPSIHSYHTQLLLYNNIVIQHACTHIFILLWWSFIVVVISNFGFLPSWDHILHESNIGRIEFSLSWIWLKTLWKTYPRASYLDHFLIAICNENSLKTFLGCSHDISKRSNMTHRLNQTHFMPH